ncbi:MAG: amidase [Proteobacteria bacterium]|nr:amidase [Pseudomonadota bacterium]
MSDLADLTLVEAADAVRKKKASAVELLDACFANIERANKQVNATIWLDYEGAKKAARRADQAVKRKAKLGRLHGVPMAHKDMYYQKGKPCTSGSKIRKDFVPGYTATVIQRMADEGAFTFGGLNMAEFAQNPTGHNWHYGNCNNPWNLPYITGGSSSGSGAALACRMTYAALGSDTGGSVRLPAAACGVTGLKPTQTRVSRYGVMPLSFSADNVGPLARTARDCARIMSIIAGADPLDPTSSKEKVPNYEAALDGKLRGLRIGVPETHFLDGVDAPVMKALEEACKVLAARGARVERMRLPMIDAVLAYAGIVSRVEAAAIHAQWMRDHAQDYAVHLSARLYGSYAIPGAYYVEALARRGPILRAFAKEVFAKVDVLATPTIRTCLPTLAETDVDRGPPGTEAKFMAVAANTRAFNYLGLPAVSLNCGFDQRGLPIGLQLAGRPFAEARVLQVADAYQRETAWHTNRPPVLKGR